MPGSNGTLVTRAGELRYWWKAANGEVEGTCSKLMDDLKEVVGCFFHSVKGSKVNSAYH